MWRVGAVLWAAVACARPGGAGTLPPVGDVADPEGEDTGAPPRPWPALCQGEGPAVPISAELRAWADDVIASSNPFFGSARLSQLEAWGDALPALDEHGVPLRLERAWRRHIAGDVRGALEDYAVAEGASGPSVTAALSGEALAWMRLAETDNCASGAASACIVPLDAAAEHGDPSSAVLAAEKLRASLARDPTAPETRAWWLNVASMATGGWPSGVEEPWRLSESFFADEAYVQPFRNVAMTYGVDGAQSPAGGASLVDVDGDGLLDVLTSTIDPHGGMSLWINVGDGRLCDAGRAAGLDGVGGILSFTTVDVEGDGDEDIFAPRGAWLGAQGEARPSLLINDGEGHFLDVAVERGLSERGPAQVSAWADVDLDGDLDLFLGREAAGDFAYPSSLFLQEADGTFIDVGADWGARDLGFVKGATWGDVDGDGDPDLAVSRLNGPNLMLRNDRVQLVDVTASVGGAEPQTSFATWFFDMDHDGDPDLFSASLAPSDVVAGPSSPSFAHNGDAWVRGRQGAPPPGAETPHLYRNDGGVLVDVTAAAGLARPMSVMGASFGDLDADGSPDLLLGTGLPDLDAQVPNLAFVQRDGRFLDATTSSRLGHLQKGHGVSFGDLDEDGDEDVLVNLGGMFTGDGFRDGLFVNAHGREGIALDLVGTLANRAAIGARVRVVTDQRARYATVGEGGSFGNNSRRVDVPLSAGEVVEAVEIDWPGGGWERVEGLEGGFVYVLTEGQGVTASRPFARIALDLSGAHAHEADPSPVP
jgi:hypothetical protein